jgi:hypothetical protein
VALSGFSSIGYRMNYRDDLYRLLQAALLLRHYYGPDHAAGMLLAMVLE